MKKKLFIAAVTIVLIVVLFFGFITVTANKGYGISQGRYLEAKNGQPMLILDNSPIQLSDRKGKISFESFDAGDEILVIHDGIEESYPGKTGVYAVFKLGDGTADDIPQTVITSLVELGWLETVLKLTNKENPATNITEKTDEPDFSVITTETISCVIKKIDGNHFIVEELKNGEKSGITYQFDYDSQNFNVGEEVVIEFRYPISASIPYGLRDVTVYKPEA